MSEDLTELFCLRAPISCALKGTGFRGELEVAWAVAESDTDLEKLRTTFVKLIADIDGRQWETAPEMLLEFCRQSLAKQNDAPVRIQLRREPDIVYILSR